MFVIERSQMVAAATEHTFAYFSDPRNLPAITPPWLRFSVTRMPGDRIFAGCEIDYTIRWLGVPLRWTTRITEYEPNVRFTDEQRRGPYAYWSHVHAFTAIGDETLMTDRIDYALPLGPLGTIAHALVVRRQLHHILDYRANVAREWLLGRT